MHFTTSSLTVALAALSTGAASPLQSFAQFRRDANDCSQATWNICTGNSISSSDASAAVNAVCSKVSCTVDSTNNGHFAETVNGITAAVSLGKWCASGVTYDQQKCIDDFDLFISGPCGDGGDESIFKSMLKLFESRCIY